MTKQVDLTSCKPWDWTRLGEGRANVVYAYTGSRPELTGKVLRLSKPRTVPRPKFAEDLEREIWSDYRDLLHPDPVQRGYNFIKQVVAPLIDKKYIARQEFAAISPDFADALLSAVGAPTGISLCSGALMQNHALLQHLSGCTLCIEIKPKWGTLPTSPAIHPDNELKTRISRFQLQQSLKLKQGKVVRSSAYDPLDMFSGDARRVSRAIRALLTEPQNNMRIFRDGQSLPFSGLALPDGGKQLAAALGGWSSSEVLQEQVATLTIVLQQVLCNEGVLSDIADMQSLDKWDIEGVHLLYRRLLEESQEASRKDEEEGSPRSPVIERLSSGSSGTYSQASPSRALQQGVCCRRQRCSAAQRILALATCQAAREELLELPRAEACGVLREYMTAAAAKDCSIMIAMRQVPFDTRVAESRDAHGSVYAASQRFEYKVAVADLDLKPLGKIQEHFELDCAIMQQAKHNRLRALSV